MLRQPPPCRQVCMSSTPTTSPVRLRIWQQNLNKSRAAQEDLINSDVHRNCDLLMLQEPFIDAYGNTKVTHKWRVVYPSSHLSLPLPPRAVIMVSTVIDTNQWSQINIPSSWDLVAVQFMGRFR